MKIATPYILQYRHKKDRAKQRQFCESQRYMKPAPSLVSLLLTTGIFAHSTVAAVDAGNGLDFLKGLSLAQLADIEVSISSKRPQRAGDAAAAVYVITAEDISRATATTIPELLRTVPGLNVAKIDANKWAISARGINGRFANKLLVMIDGRSVYTPLFSGVFWDVQDTVLQDIDRIEVIRGPGAAAWGANAVNGVINIITKDTADTQGGLAYISAGNEERANTAVRYGGKIGEDLHYRVYAKYDDHDEAVLATGVDAVDEQDRQRAGFRVDWSQNDSNQFTVQGDIYEGSSRETLSVGNLLNPLGGYQSTFNSDIETSGGNVLAKWQHTSGQDHHSAKIFYDNAKREDAVIDYKRETFDLEYQHAFSYNAATNFVWGLGYRFIRDKFSNNPFVSLMPDRNKEELISAFVQSDHSFADETVIVTLGARLEHNGYSGFEAQPSARVRWHIAENTLLWAALSRAARTPGRGDHHASLPFAVQPPSAQTGGLPVLLEAHTSDDFETETLLAHELGFRTDISATVRMDLTVFYNAYDKLRSAEIIGAPVFMPFFHGTPTPIFAPHLHSNLGVANNVQGHAFGSELALEWHVSDKWRFRGNWSTLYMNMRARTRSTDFVFVGQEDQAPEHQLNLMSSINPSPNLALDVTLRYVDDIEGYDIDSYVALDARVAWHIKPELELSVAAENLFDSHHPEYQGEIFDVHETEVERSIYARIQYQF